jgi:hypothetical protein
VADSIRDLQAIFKELAVLVIDQVSLGGGGTQSTVLLCFEGGWGWGGGREGVKVG